MRENSSSNALPTLQPTESAGNPSLFQMQRLTDLSLRLEVPLDVVEVSIRDILALQVGSVLELERMTGEAFDVVVNGTPVARGEVRVHGEKLAIRVTEVLGIEWLGENGEGKEARNEGTKPPQ